MLFINHILLYIYFTNKNIKPCPVHNKKWKVDVQANISN